MSRTFTVILKMQHGRNKLRAFVGLLCMGSLQLWTFYVISEIRFIVLECQNKLKHTYRRGTDHPSRGDRGGDHFIKLRKLPLLLQSRPVGIPDPVCKRYSDSNRYIGRDSYSDSDRHTKRQRHRKKETVSEKPFGYQLYEQSCEIRVHRR